MRCVERATFYLAHEIQSPGFTLVYQHLKRNQWKPRDQLIDEQNEKLRRLVQFSYDYVPYYRRKFKTLKLQPHDIREIADLEKLPPIDKRTIISNKQDFYPRGYRTKFNTRTTGGTTGTPFSFRISHRVRFLSAALIYRGWSAAGYSLGDRILFFAGSSLIPKESTTLSKLANQIGRNLRSVSSFDISPQSLNYCLDLISSWKPSYLRGYPSSIVELANHIDKMKKDPPQLKAIFTTSENLYPHIRERIESVFGAKVYDGYGANDGGVQSFECEHTKMHVSTERSILEVVDKDNIATVGETGRILATDLENYIMPLLRYDIGDDAVASDEDCTCGRGSPILDSLIGRTVSIFVTPDGKLIHGWFFLYMFWEYGERVQDYKVTQVTEYDIQILIVPGVDFDSSIIRNIEETTRSNCEDWIVEIHIVDEIPKTTSGKKIFIESKVKRDKKHENNT
ncbi:MAG: phenylacetate--CoA ligase family protein [Candidatus Thorarchaeota archaeon]